MPTAAHRQEACLSKSGQTSIVHAHGKHAHHPHACLTPKPELTQSSTIMRVDDTLSLANGPQSRSASALHPCHHCWPAGCCALCSAQATASAATYTAWQIQGHGASESDVQALWHGMAWRSMLEHGIAWHGHGLAWHGMARHTPSNCAMSWPSMAGYSGPPASHATAAAAEPSRPHPSQEMNAQLMGAVTPQ